MIAGGGPEAPRQISGSKFAQDMVELGLADELALAPVQDEEEVECFPVWADNWPTLHLFLRLQSKWYVHSAPDGEMIRSGIRPEAIEFVLRSTVGVGRRQWPSLIRDIEAMERAALIAMSEVRAARREQRKRELEEQYRKLGL